MPAGADTWHPSRIRRPVAARDCRAVSGSQGCTRSSVVVCLAQAPPHTSPRRRIVACVAWFSGCRRAESALPASSSHSALPTQSRCAVAAIQGSLGHNSRRRIALLQRGQRIAPPLQSCHSSHDYTGLCRLRKDALPQRGRRNAPPLQLCHTCAEFAQTGPWSLQRVPSSQQGGSCSVPPPSRRSLRQIDRAHFAAARRRVPGIAPPKIRNRRPTAGIQRLAGRTGIYSCAAGCTSLSRTGPAGRILMPQHKPTRMPSYKPKVSGLEHCRQREKARAFAAQPSETPSPSAVKMRLQRGAQCGAHKSAHSRALARYLLALAASAALRLSHTTAR